jgi:purine-binding chemotaxis protein CheW
MTSTAMVDSTQTKSRTRGNKVLFFRAGNHRCGVPIARVVRILKYQEVTALPKSAEFVMGMFNLQGKIMPVLDFAMRLANRKFVSNENSCIVILQSEREGKSVAFGVAVEEVLGVVDVAPDSIQDPPPGVEGVDTQLVRGILGKNDDLRLMIDVDSICASKDWDNNSKDGAASQPTKGNKD